MPNLTDQIEQKLKQIIADELSITENQITPDARFTHDFPIDDVGRTKLLSVIEQNFGVSFSIDETDNLTTVGSVISLLNEKL